MSTGKDTEAYVEGVYQSLREVAMNLDSLYEDYIITIVGTTGLMTLLANGYLETCGAINGRQLYVLCCEGES
jgi:hypothetical protein